MRRKYVCIAFLFGIALNCWIYWKSNAAFNEARIIQPPPLSSPSNSPTTTSVGWEVAEQKNTAVTAARAAKKRETTRKMYHTIKDVSLEPFPTTCRKVLFALLYCKRHLFLVIIVTSHVGNVKLRSSLRRVMPAEELRKINVARVFLLAQIPEKEKYITQSVINDESKTFGDILQGSFVENYRNLTYKHLMGLRWASTICQEASFIIKKDDDALFHLDRVYTLLNAGNYSTSLLMGFILKDTLPWRIKISKWYVTWEEYPRHEFPPYLSGLFYITTPKVATALCDEAIYHPYLWIDDIFITGLLRESLGLELTKLPEKIYK